MSAPYWKHRATRCAVVGCERQRVRGWSTCALVAHHSLGRSLADAGRLQPIPDPDDYVQRHALFATTADGVTFRVGQPVAWSAAQERWGRFALGTRNIRLRHARRWYALPLRGLEVRATDRHGRGLGSERHERAIPVPYRALRFVP